MRKSRKSCMLAYSSPTTDTMGFMLKLEYCLSSACVCRVTRELFHVCTYTLYPYLLHIVRTRERDKLRAPKILACICSVYVYCICILLVHVYTSRMSVNFIVLLYWEVRRMMMRRWHDRCEWADLKYQHFRRDSGRWRTIYYYISVILWHNANVMVGRRHWDIIFVALSNTHDVNSYILHWYSWQCSNRQISWHTLPELQA